MIKNNWRINKFGEWYWLKSNGVMASNETLTINGVSRTFNDQGVCINPN
jgi:glucan-binding YG repeat protein